MASAPGPAVRRKCCMHVFLIRDLSLPRNNCRSVPKKRSILYLQSVCSNRRGLELLGVVLMCLSRCAAHDVSFDWTEIPLHVCLSACQLVIRLIFPVSYHTKCRARLSFPLPFDCLQHVMYIIAAHPYHASNHSLPMPLLQGGSRTSRGQKVTRTCTNSCTVDVWNDSDPTQKDHTSQSAPYWSGSL